MNLKVTLVSILFAIVFSCKDKTSIETVHYLNYNIELSTLVDSLAVQPENLSILIEKKSYKLSLIAENNVVKEYPVVFGKNSIDDKLMEGDMRTPEGNFKIRDLYPHKSWSKFLWIDYPTKNSFKRHNEAKKIGQIPADSEIGGEIGIHGVPKGKSYLINKKINWTWGCISLTNKDIDELYQYANRGMEIKIIK